MLIEINGDALRLLERFVKYSTTPSLSVDVSDALYCSHDELLRRAGQLKEQIKAAKKKGK